MRIEHKYTAVNIELCCSLLGYSRQAYYQAGKRDQKSILEGELLIRRVISERKLQKRIGGRKLHFLMQDFMRQHDIKMGRDAFFSLLGKQGLLIRKHRSRAITTNSNHWFRRYPNLIREFIPVMPNQLWVADITYLVIGNGFGYLSLITDAYSHKIVGYCLHRNLTVEGSILALKMALLHNRNIHGLIHHSDRGIQYCCNDYVAALQSQGIRISMTEKGDPLENAVAERVNGILKEELFEKSYLCFDDARRAVAEAVGTYNFYRPHNSIANYTPQQAHSVTGIELKRLWKNYYQPKKEIEIQAV